jgi:hypothetical protein
MVLVELPDILAEHIDTLVVKVVEVLYVSSGVMTELFHRLILKICNSIGYKQYVIPK